MWGWGNRGLSEVATSSYVKKAPYETICGHEKVCLEYYIAIGSNYVQ